MLSVGHCISEDRLDNCFWECWKQAKTKMLKRFFFLFIQENNVAVFQFSEQWKEFCVGKSCGERSAPTRYRRCHPKTPYSAAGACFPRGWSENSWRWKRWVRSKSMFCLVGKRLLIFLVHFTKKYCTVKSLLGRNTAIVTAVVFIQQKSWSQKLLDIQNT